MGGVIPEIRGVALFSLRGNGGIGWRRISCAQRSQCGPKASPSLLYMPGSYQELRPDPLALGIVPITPGTSMIRGQIEAYNPDFVLKIRPLRGILGHFFDTKSLSFNKLTWSDPKQESPWANVRRFTKRPGRETPVVDPGKHATGNQSKRFGLTPNEKGPPKRTFVVKLDNETRGDNYLDTHRT